MIDFQAHSNRRLWNVFKLQRINEGDPQAVLTPDVFKRKLKKELQLHFHLALKIDLVTKNDAYWIRVQTQKDTPNVAARRQKGVIYLVHYPGTEFLMATQMNKGHSQFVLQAFAQMLDCTEIVKIELKGHHVTSLAQLAINRYGQGGFSKFRLNQVDGNPLSKRRSRKRKASELELECPGVTQENLREEMRSKDILEETFGDHPQPILEKVEYTLETKFKGLMYAPAMATQEEAFHCKVKFEGTNVIEGIKNLCKVGLADLPMKDHLGKIHSMAKSSFLLRQKGLGTPTK